MIRRKSTGRSDVVVSAAKVFTVLLADAREQIVSALRTELAEELVANRYAHSAFLCGSASPIRIHNM